jgi:hypothetical protein
MFLITWMFDKLGYMPKIDMQVGVVKDAWPFPKVSEDFDPRPKEKSDSCAKKKPTVKKATTRKPKANVVAKSVRTKKVK